MTPAVTTWSLAGVFLRLGATSFGGSMLPLMEEAVVHRRRWLTAEQFAEGIALAELVPGPVALKVAAYIGHARCGVVGALVAIGCFSAPTLLLVVIASLLWFRAPRELPLASLLTFVAPVAAGLFLVTAWRPGRRSLVRPTDRLIAGVTLTALASGASPLFVLWGWGVGYATWTALRRSRAWSW